MRSIFICAALLVSVGCRGSDGPYRKPGIPPTAVWVGGREDGEWIFCEALDAKGQRRFCKVFDGRSGGTRSSGEYVLRQIAWSQELGRSEYEETSAAPPALQYQSFDGQSIILADNLILLPDGWIDYPSGGGHGQRQQYRAGLKLGDSRPY
ncbi:MAG: hypothetical protein WKF30_02690 [Pyrinomonadaceae bacterium]